MKISMNGLGEQVATFEAGTNVAVGAPVAITANGIVSAAANSGDFCGVCTRLENGFATVQMKGYIRVAYTGTVAVGRATLNGSTGGKVKPSTGTEVAIPVQVVDVDTAAKTIGIIL